MVWVEGSGFGYLGVGELPAFGKSANQSVSQQDTQPTQPTQPTSRPFCQPVKLSNVSCPR
ncbi:hypothetical protein CANDROIZ_300002 [Candidatus Roizmanbacteria bacterium]|nr:hypothetical protein CANDROIZ_300002 [Candidatus Roizmanbacteria bacterium]